MKLCLYIVMVPRTQWFVSPNAYLLLGEGALLINMISTEIGTEKNNIKFIWSSLSIKQSEI